MCTWMTWPVRCKQVDDIVAGARCGNSSRGVPVAPFALGLRASTHTPFVLMNAMLKRPGCPL